MNTRVKRQRIEGRCHYRRRMEEVSQLVLYPLSPLYPLTQQEVVMILIQTSTTLDHNKQQYLDVHLHLHLQQYSQTAQACTKPQGPVPGPSYGTSTTTCKERGPGTCPEESNGQDRDKQQGQQQEKRYPSVHQQTEEDHVNAADRSQGGDWSS